jgi:hypothetical protein
MKSNIYNIHFKNNFQYISSDYILNRTALFSLIRRISNKMGFKSQTYFLSIYYLDILFSKNKKIECNYKTLGLACLLLSAKYIENDPYVPNLPSFIKAYNIVVGYKYIISVTDLFYAEVLTCKMLGYKLNYYTIYYPLKSEFNEKPLSLPALYKTCFILNENFKEQEIRKFAEIENVNNSNNSMSFASSERSVQSVQSRISILGEIIPYVKFQNLYHIHSNHLHSQLFHNNENTVINSMTSRYRFKFSTFIYYKPNTPVEPVQRIKHSQTVRLIFDKIKRNEKKNII